MKLLTTLEFNDLDFHSQAEYINKLANKYGGEDWLGYNKNTDCYYDKLECRYSGASKEECKVDNLYIYILELIVFKVLMPEEAFKI